MPFDTASKNDPYYKCIYKKKLETFWKAHDKRMKKKGRKTLSLELKELIGAILSKNELTRPSLD